MNFRDVGAVPPGSAKTVTGGESLSTVGRLCAVILGLRPPIQGVHRLACTKFAARHQVRVHPQGEARVRMTQVSTQQRLDVLPGIQQHGSARVSNTYMPCSRAEANRSPPSGSGMRPATAKAGFHMQSLKWLTPTCRPAAPVTYKPLGAQLTVHGAPRQGDGDRREHLG